MFTAKDLKQLRAKGIGMEVVERQLEYFRSGFPFLRLDRAATVGDGIRQLTAEETGNLERTYERKLGNRKVYKFVPASGAATRMFKDLYEYLQAGGDRENAAMQEVFEQLKKFAFYPKLKRLMDRKHINPSDKKQIAAAILLQDGLNYGSLPKGMLLFHKYAGGARTALEEHLAEGARYAANADGSVNLHFTVSPEHLQGFETLVERKVKKYSELFGVHYHIGFSQQKPSTDILAVDRDNRPVRNADGSILFRPGGHGALLENLNDLDADLIFVKNIDNVAPDSLKPATVRYKKALAGLLIELQEQAAGHYRLLLGAYDEELVKKVLRFLVRKLSFQPPAVIFTWPAEGVRTYLLDVLHRPIRVCGMVKNEGEPGGGPFWVRNSDGSASLQIAESSQIDMNDPQQKAMAAAATHFNPVDLVCAVKDADGNPFDLLLYRDPNTGFISKKSKDGVELKAQELPGLWNGAMARWNTVFVEVPIETFNPVKTINDLLRPQHQ
ncbi:MAG: DUF4301 family protein [Bacteroidales bacterium]|jgi:hypothetical protein|nr:DUF4301 family protein [Bacteroidales bacterium]